MNNKAKRPRINSNPGVCVCSSPVVNDPETEVVAQSSGVITILSLASNEKSPFDSGI